MQRLPRTILFATLLLPGTFALAQPPGAPPQTTPSQATVERHGSHRQNERVTADGRIRSIRPERGGYRVELDRGDDSFWVPERTYRQRPNDFRVGVSIRFGGIFRDGFVTVDVVDWLPLLFPPVPTPQRVERAGLLRGVVERVDYRHNTLVVRSEETGRLVTVYLVERDRRWNRPSRFGDLRRGDYVVLSGEWTRGRDFEADHIDSTHPRDRHD